MGIMILTIVILILTPLRNYLFVGKEDISFVGRVELFREGINYLSHNLLYGSGGYRDGLILAEHIFPHQLFLMKGVMYGALVMMLSFMLVYIYPIKCFITSKNKSFISTAILCILILQSLTNNETCPGLFWTSLAAVFIELSPGRIISKE